MRLITHARGALILATALLVMASGAQAQPNPITLFLGEGTANRGDTALITVELGVGNTRPANMVVWLRYNPAKIRPNTNAFEFTVVDVEGNPIRDQQGNTITSRGAVRREQSLIDAEKQIDVEVHPEGAMGIAIQGINGTGIAPGPILTLAFTAQQGVAENEIVALEGAEESDPVQFTSDGDLVTAWSSASFQSGSGATLDLEIGISDGRIVVPCTQPLAASTVTATTDRPDAVQVSWAASPTLGVQYRVYRSETNNVSTALPLGTGPQSATTFTDVTALAPAVPASGCACNATATPVRYFYWVRTLSATGCEGPFTTPAVEGSRSVAKAASAKASITLDTSPTAAFDAAANFVSPGETVAVYLDNVVPASVWAEAVAGAWRSEQLRWNGDAASGWAGVELPTDLADGETVLLTVGATHHAGVPVGPFVREFVVRGAAAKSNAGMVNLGLDAVPYLPEGVGSVYAAGGESVLSNSLTVDLPVTDGVDPASLVVYAYIDVQGERRWYLAENVGGLLASAPEVVGEGADARIQLSLRHGAVLQLGTPPAEVPATQIASVAPNLPAGDLVLLAAVALVFLLARTRRARI